jgi:tetratricopeptide (TPR) repeat protein
MTSGIITSSTRAGCNQRCESEERPRKQLRFCSSLDSLSVLTEIGIANFFIGKYERAEKFFSRALYRVDVLYLCNTVHQLSIEYLEMSGDASWKILPSQSDASIDQIEDDLQANHKQHEYDEGMHIYDNILSVSENGGIDSIASILFYNIAQTFARRNKYQDAKTWFERALVRSQITADFAPENSVKILHNLGNCAYRIGNNEEAMKSYKCALSMALKFSLNEHDLAVSLNCVGVLHFLEQKDEETETALQLLQQSLGLYRSSCSSFVQIATVLNNIGRVHYLRSEFVQALTVYEECLQLRRQLGNHPMDVAVTIYNIGQTYHQLGRLEESLKFYKDFLCKIKPQLGAKSRDVATVYKCMADIHHERSESKLALACFTKSLHATRASLGNSHPEVASILNKLGNLSYEMQDYCAAMKFYKKGLEIEREILEPNHPHLIVTMINIAHIHKHRGDYTTALSIYKHVHAMQIVTYGCGSIEVAGSLSSMGLMQYNLKDFEASFESYQGALQVRRDYYGSDDHVDIASTLNSVGLVLFKQEMYELAKSCFGESLRIRRELLGPNHHDVAILWYNMGTVFFETGEDELAVKFYKETLRVERKALGYDHPDVVLTLQHLGQVYQQLGNLEEALMYLLEALRIERTSKEGKKMSDGKILNRIGNVYLQQGNVVGMMKTFSEASRIFEAEPAGTEALVIAGYNFYGLSKTNPPCAPVA